MLAALKKTGSSVSPLGLGFVIFFSVVMLWPAFLNRYPLIDWDSNAYVDTITHWTGLSRPFPYSIFLLITSFHRSAWGTVIAQALLVSTITWFTLLTVCGTEGSFEFFTGSHPEGSTRMSRPQLVILAIIVLIACGVSALPYYTSLIMPDLFTLTAILSFFVLLYTRSRFRAGFAFALLALSASVHGSNAPILAIFGCWWILSRRRRRWLIASAAVGSGLLLGGVTHKIMTGTFYWRELGSTVLFARLVQDGLIQRTLEASCPEQPNAFCAYTVELKGETSDGYLWSPRSVRSRLGDEGHAAERALIFRSLRLFPVENASAVWRHFVRGLDNTIGTYYTMPGLTRPYREIAKRALPADVKLVKGAIQVNREGEWFPEIRRMITRLTWLAILLSLASGAYVLAPAHRPRVLTSIAIGLAAGVASNALVMSSVGDDTYGRYFTRVNGLIFVIAALLVGNAIHHFWWRRRLQHQPSRPNATISTAACDQYR